LRGAIFCVIAPMNSSGMSMDEVLHRLERLAVYPWWRG